MTGEELLRVVEKIHALEDENARLREQVESLRRELAEVYGDEREEQPGSACTGSSCGWCGRCS